MPSFPAPLSILSADDAPVCVRLPDCGGAPTPLVFASPHSGRGAPADFLPLLRPSSAMLRRVEDAHVDQLFEAAPRHGAPLVRALFARAFVDANREPAELDPVMLDGPAPSWINSASPRVANGLGVLPRLTVDGGPIHRRRLTLAEAQARIERFHAPYHRALAGRLDAARAQHGLAVLIDCHSMPTLERTPTPDIVLGDRFGLSCHPAVSDVVETLFRAQGFSVQRNTPYAGGYTTAHYGRPRRHTHAIQVELRRAVYMDEETLEPLPGVFAAVQARLTAIVAQLSAVDWSGLLRQRDWRGLAAE